MFEAAELGRRVSKREFEERLTGLRIELLEVQRALRTAADFPVVVVIAGVDGAGKSETVNVLHTWLDPRHLVTRAYAPPSDEERERPEFWRFWRDLPRRGTIGFFLSSWYSRPVLDHVYGETSRAQFDQRLARIAAFEQALADDGALILKFWMHLNKEAQKRRLKALHKDPLQQWRVRKEDWRHWRKYDKFVAAAERTLQRTSTGDAPWNIVEGVDERYRTLTVATLLCEGIRKHLARVAPKARAAAAGAPAPEPVRGKRGAKRRAAGPPAVQHTILDSLDMTRSLCKKDCELELDRQRGRLNQLQRRAAEQGVSLILVFEGWDAAGKGGAIRRLVPAFDARGYQVISIAAPTDEERAHHYLWRFWRHIGRAGRVTIFDRSWYGRVLVERVEGFATEPEWMRAYAEINQFEEQLVEHGIVLAKYWLHITPDEQLRRFQERERTPFKQFKLTDEDWRNRDRWDLYERAVNDMIERTSTRLAPWTLVEANDKRYARVKVIRTAAERLERALRRR